MQTDNVHMAAESIQRDRPYTREDEVKMEAVAAPSVELFIVTVRDAGPSHGNPAQFFDIWAEDLENAHRTVTAILRNRHDDWTSNIVGIMATNSYRYP